MCALALAGLGAMAYGSRYHPNAKGLSDPLDVPTDPQAPRQNSLLRGVLGTATSGSLTASSSAANTRCAGPTTPDWIANPANSKWIVFGGDRGLAEENGLYVLPAGDMEPDWWNARKNQDVWAFEHKRLSTDAYGGKYSLMLDPPTPEEQYIYAYPVHGCAKGDTKYRVSVWIKAESDKDVHFYLGGLVRRHQCGGNQVEASEPSGTDRYGCRAACSPSAVLRDWPASGGGVTRETEEAFPEKTRLPNRLRTRPGGEAMRNLLQVPVSVEGIRDPAAAVAT